MNALVNHAWYPIKVDRLRVLVACGLMLACFFTPAESLGQPPSPDDLAAGRQLFAEALEDEDHHRFAAALEKYKRVLRIRDTTAIRYRMGVTLEGLGKITEAVESYKEAIVLGTTSSSDAELVRAAQARIVALEPKIAHLTIRPAQSTPSDAEVRVDDTPVRADGLADVRVDPGPHVVTMTASDGRSSSARVTLSEGGRAEIPIALAPPPPPRPTTPEARDGSSLRTTGIVTAAAGGALVIGGLVVLALRSSDVSKLDESCPQGNCPLSREQELRDTRDRALWEGPVGGALVGVGAVAVGTGAVLFLIGGNDGKTATRLVPRMTTTSGLTLTLTRSF